MQDRISFANVPTSYKISRVSFIKFVFINVWKRKHRKNTSETAWTAILTIFQLHFYKSFKNIVLISAIPDDIRNHQVHEKSLLDSDYFIIFVSLHQCLELVYFSSMFWLPKAKARRKTQTLLSIPFLFLIHWTLVSCGERTLKSKSKLCVQISCISSFLSCVMNQDSV